MVPGSQQGSNTKHQSHPLRLPPNYESFSLSLLLMTSPVLNVDVQAFCTVSFKWYLSNIFLIVRLQVRVLGGDHKVKCHFHQFISNLQPTNMTYCSCRPWLTQCWSGLSTVKLFYFFSRFHLPWRRWHAQLTLQEGGARLYPREDRVSTVGYICASLFPGVAFCSIGLHICSSNSAVLITAVL